MTSTINGYLYTDNYKPNKQYVTNNPIPQLETPRACCNQAKFAYNRVKSMSAPMKQNYYSGTRQYLHARCNTFEQRSFNFKTGGINTQTNMPNYYANCQPSAGNTTQQDFVFNILQIFVQLNIIAVIPTGIYTFTELEAYISTLPQPNNTYANNIYYWYMNDPYMGLPASGPSPNVCKQVMYKPSNKQFANQGAVYASQFTLYKSFNTIATSKVPTMIGKLKYGTPLTQCVGHCLGWHIRGGQ